MDHDELANWIITFLQQNCLKKRMGSDLIGTRPYDFQLVPGAAAIRRRRQPLSFKPQSAVKLVASQLSRR